MNDGVSRVTHDSKVIKCSVYLLRVHFYSFTEERIRNTRMGGFYFV